MSFVTIEVFPSKVLSHLKFYKSFGLVSIEFCPKECSVTVWVLFQFVLSQFRFVTIWVLLQFQFFKIIGLSHFMFSPYCKISTLCGIFYLSLVTIFSRYASLLLFSPQKKYFLHYGIVFSVTKKFFFVLFCFDAILVLI